MNKQEELPKVSNSNTKKELLDAYNQLLKKYETKVKQELNPEKIVETKKVTEIINTANTMTDSGISAQISSLKNEILKNLNSLEQDFNTKTAQYHKLVEAIKIREEQLKELYEIEKAASSLACLIEAHKEKKEEQENYIKIQKEQLDAEIKTKKTALEIEIKETKAKFDLEMKDAKVKWEKEQKEHELFIKERNAKEEKLILRQKEEYTYNFEREKQQAINLLNDEKMQITKEIAIAKETHAKEIAESLKDIESREISVSDREKSITELENKVNNFPKELETAVNKTIKEINERLSNEHKSHINLLNKEFEGKSNVYLSKIESLTAQCEEQKAHIAKLTESLSAAYEKVQNIAVRTVEGATNFKFNQEQTKQPLEKN